MSPPTFCSVALVWILIEFGQIPGGNPRVKNGVKTAWKLSGCFFLHISLRKTPRNSSPSFHPRIHLEIHPGIHPGVHTKKSHFFSAETWPRHMQASATVAVAFSNAMALVIFLGFVPSTAAPCGVIHQGRENSAVRELRISTATQLDLSMT